eukprot:CAMPEP_0198238788 /NCGR_PEP_ID=MMETSP1446-20131203/4346_1 /TAXON_ID=1461542 ORGANISM="Unidentified sp, Strain CCMP2111" /NCGR_SAMPLE_ID=MMETSP1446 /ASSEMBLY_ACC=CAM_ASM_001112 /LENGTH=54 /DNA_ID=CAMNT_0043921255 /DNA_START=290 /DNA_END=454 /DNA_ORIENTATION=+
MGPDLMLLPVDSIADALEHAHAKWEEEKAYLYNMYTKSRTTLIQMTTYLIPIFG